jgi:hypothetical protein
MILVGVFRVGTPCSGVVGYQRFRDHFTLKMEGARTPETLISYHNTLHDVTTKKNSTWTITSVEAIKITFGSSGSGYCQGEGSDEPVASIIGGDFLD